MLTHNKVNIKMRIKIFFAILLSIFIYLTYIYNPQLTSFNRVLYKYQCLFPFSSVSRNQLKKSENLNVYFDLNKNDECSYYIYSGENRVLRVRQSGDQLILDTYLRGSDIRDWYNGKLKVFYTLNGIYKWAWLGVDSDDNFRPYAEKIFVFDENTHLVNFKYEIKKDNNLRPVFIDDDGYLIRLPNKLDCADGSPNYLENR